MKDVLKNSSRWWRVNERNGRREGEKKNLFFIQFLPSINQCLESNCSTPLGQD